jgi:hypothetical protein
MQLKLKHKPTPEHAAVLADLVVPVAREVSGADLDYSPNSLCHVDRIIETFRRDGVRLEQIAETLFSFGCYVGEVFVRHAGGRWRVASETPLGQFAGGPIVVQTGPADFCNPIDRVFKRFENGAEEDLTYFWSVFGRKPPGERE